MVSQRGGRVPRHKATGVSVSVSESSPKGRRQGRTSVSEALATKERRNERHPKGRSRVGLKPHSHRYSS
ncbi:MAG: hypothetical protein PUP93_04000 [Rhizonema sp. NSF051]|nr:hypothetical protein [Rhizonema sp. NSF051]